MWEHAHTGEQKTHQSSIMHTCTEWKRGRDRERRFINTKIISLQVNHLWLSPPLRPQARSVRQHDRLCFDHKSQDRKRRSCAKAYLIISPWSKQLASNDKADERCDDCSDVIWWGVNSRQLTWRFQEVFPCQRDLKTVSSRQKPCQVGAPNCWWSWQLAWRWANKILQWFCLLISLLISQ